MKVSEYGIKSDVHLLLRISSREFANRKTSVLFYNECTQVLFFSCTRLKKIPTASFPKRMIAKMLSVVNSEYLIDIYKVGKISENHKI